MVTKGSESPIKVTMGVETLKDILFPQPPKYTKLTFTSYAYTKMMVYAHLIGSYEITGFGRIVDDKVVDIKILRQTVKPAEVDCNVEAMEEFLLSTPREELGQWVLDWHSHVDMGVFASGTDSSNYKLQFEGRRRKQFPYVIINKSGGMYSKCYCGINCETPLEILKETTPLSDEEFEAIYSECKKDIETLCTKKSYTSTYSVWGKRWEKDDYEDDYYDSYYGGYYDRYGNVSRPFPTSSQQKLSTAYCGKTGVTDEDEEEDKKKSIDYEKLAEKNVKAYDDYNCYVSDDADVCLSCGCTMAYEDEIERGLCDDCWQQLPPNQRVEWAKSRYLTIK